MNRFNSSSPLLPKVQEDTVNNDFMTEDASSGYDTSDNSDAESDISKHSSPEKPEKRSKSRTTSDLVPDIMKVRCTHTLSADLRAIMTLPEMCDVKFLVGPSEIPLYGVRAILAMRSRIFYQLILKHIQIAALQKKVPKRLSGAHQFSSDRLVIPVKKYDPKVFGMLIEFVHSGVITLSAETVPGLLCGAEQFLLEDLSNACWDFLDRSLAAGNSEVLLEHTKKYSHHKAAKKIFDKIYSFTGRKARYEPDMQKSGRS